MNILKFFRTVYVRERALMPESERQLSMSLRLFEQQLGPIDLDCLSHEHLNRWQRENPRGWSPKTMKRRVLDVLAVWTYAYVIGATENQPNRLRVRPVRVPTRIPNAWTMQDLQTMLTACEQFTTYLPNGVQRGMLLRATILVGFYSALRATDLFTLRRDQLSADGSPVPQHKKHGSQVLCIIPDWVIDEIDARYPADVELVVAWPYRRETFYALWRKMLVAAKLPTGPRHGLQKLRRTAVSHGEAIARGFGAQLAGHATTRVTYASYVDPRILQSHCAVSLPDLRHI